MNRLQYLLTKLAEEASEIAQIALKTQQFGLDEVYQVESNRERCHAEIDDLMSIVTILNREYSFGYSPDITRMKNKEEKIDKYYQYSVDLGLVADG